MSIKQVSDAIGAHVMEAGQDPTALLADISSFQSHLKPSAIFKDLSNANPRQGAEAVRVSEAVFVVSTTDSASIKDACAQAVMLRDMMRSLKREDAFGLLLVPSSGGITEQEGPQPPYTRTVPFKPMQARCCPCGSILPKE